MIKKSLIVLLGPTGVGKTELSLRLAEHYRTPVISSDSRQLYKDLSIGTAAPTPDQQKRVQHYFIGTLGLKDYYSAAQYEEDTIALIETLHKTHPTLLMTGGSMMYIDAVCKGIDTLPTISTEIRGEVLEKYHREGLESLCEELKQKDYVYYHQVDLKNHKRVIHALEICRMTGSPYSLLRTNIVKERPFRIIKVGLTREREELFSRINCRVEEMVVSGLVEEARRVYDYRSENSLNTVGYKEIFNYLDGIWTLEEAIEKIKKNTRVYSKKQMTWFKRDSGITWFHPNDERKIIAYIDARQQE